MASTGPGHPAPHRPGAPSLQARRSRRQRPSRLALSLAWYHGGAARCDVAELAGRTVDTLSGGEWQRVRLARALAQQPQVLVLDEPTTSLDVRHEMELFELVRRLVDGGLAGLVITHHINLAARYADRILLLSGGRVAGEGRPAAVLREDTLRAVFDWPVAVTTWGDGSPQVVPLRPGESPDR